MPKNRFYVIQYRNHKDFKFGSWKFQIHNNGGLTVSGKLKKNNCKSKYMDVKKDG